ncbi:MAG: prolipoprotein diacylglyceryl transferase family protein [Desulfovibrio sp.]
METFIFTLILSLLCGGLVVWGAATLPKEGWQMLGAVPIQKNTDGSWAAMNFTYYGLFNGLSYTLATALATVLISAIHVPVSALLFIVLGVLGICIPASKLIASIVEKKKHTFSVGGASFAGIILTPWITYTASLYWTEIQVLPILAAVSIAYTLGEGTGRLACLSFGCCYGRPIDSLPEDLKPFFAKISLIFQEKTRKISYADGLDGVPVVPVQVITASLYCASAIAGTVFFLTGYYTAAFLETLIVTQLWRFVSEFLRADYRGGGMISAYQLMSFFAVLYASTIPLLLPLFNSVIPNISVGIATLWSPTALLGLQFLFIFTFIYTGKSSVTSATIHFHIRGDRI